MQKTFNIGSKTFFLLLGSGRRIALGFCINLYGIDLEFGPWFLTLEWWDNDSKI